MAFIGSVGRFGSPARTSPISQSGLPIRAQSKEHYFENKEDLYRMDISN
jgi:hypothetical protein